MNQHSFHNLLWLGTWGLFSLVFTAQGIEIGLSSIKIANTEFRMRNWDEVPCTISAVRILEAREPGRPFDALRVTYQYQWNGAERIGAEISQLCGFDGHQSDIQRTFENWDRLRQTGQPTRCWVDPKDPANAVLIRDARCDFVTGHVLAAMVLSGGCGWGLAVIVWTAIDQWRRNSRESTGSRPWECRTDWKCGRIVDSVGRQAYLAMALIGWFIVLSAAPLLMGLRAYTQGQSSALWGFLPAGLTMVLFFLVLQRLIHRWRRFGDSVFIMASTPGTIGGELCGVIRPQRLPESAQGYELLLRCTETKSDGNDESATSAVVAEEARIVKEEVRTGETGELAIPVVIPIPITSPPTLVGSYFSHRTWKLRVKSLTPGHGYQATFEVPLFVTGTEVSDPGPRPTVDRVLAPVDQWATLKAAGVRVESLDHDGWRFTFCRGRNLGFHLGIVLGQTLICAIFIGLAYLFWPAAWWWVCGSSVLLVASSIVDRLCYCSEIEMTQYGLAIRGGWFRLRTPRHVRWDEVKYFDRKDEGSIGSHHATTIRLFRKRSFRPIIVAKYVVPLAVTERVLAQLHAQLHNPRGADSRDSSPVS